MGCTIMEQNSAGRTRVLLASDRSAYDYPLFAVVAVQHPGRPWLPDIFMIIGYQGDSVVLVRKLPDPPDLLGLSEINL